MRIAFAQAGADVGLESGQMLGVEGPQGSVARGRCQPERQTEIGIATVSVQHVTGEDKAR